VKIDEIRIQMYLSEIRKNSLVHRYWRIDDRRLIDNIRGGKEDFDRFIAQVEAYLEEKRLEEKRPNQ
jgi:uncharacterized protein YutE (UPF0331/DUF86 family)